MTKMHTEEDRPGMPQAGKAENNEHDIIQMVTGLKSSDDTSHFGTSEAAIPKELKAKLRLFEKITSNINEFIWSVSLENHHEEIYFSESVKKITGYTNEEIINSPGRLQALIHAEDAFDVRKKMTEFESSVSQDTIVLIYRIQNKKEETIWIKESIFAERNNIGKIIRFDAVVTDITEIKKAELMAKEAEEKIKRLNEAKDRFISIISHDLRAPFTSILGFAEILLNESSLSEHDKQEYLNYIFESSQSQLQMVNYLLDWSRLQTGRVKLEPQRLKARTLIDNCVSSLTGNAIRKNIQIDININDDICIQADEKLISQAITNLLSNAIKFTDLNRSIEVSAGHFKKDFIEFIFKDEGIGISEENKRKLFVFDQKFTSDGTRGEKGSGLGLTLVKEIIEKHGGDIWFYSEINKGSEFHFIIPEAHNVVLLVEDDVSSRNLWQKIITRTLPNFEIIQAANGYEAMSIIMDKIPSLVITDHNMPLMNGIQLIESMRTREESNKVPVIVIAALLSEEQRDRYFNLGVEKILPKPIDIKELSSTLLGLIN